MSFISLICRNYDFFRNQSYGLSYGQSNLPWILVPHHHHLYVFVVICPFAVIVFYLDLDDHDFDCDDFVLILVSGNVIDAKLFFIIRIWSFCTESSMTSWLRHHFRSLQVWSWSDFRFHECCQSQVFRRLCITVTTPIKRPFWFRFFDKMSLK